MVVLSPDVEKIFQMSESVNEALGALVRGGKSHREKFQRDALLHGSQLQKPGERIMVPGNFLPLQSISFNLGTATSTRATR